MLNELSKGIHEMNVKKGFYENKKEIGTMLMLIVSELSEALEADRINKHADLQNFIDCKNMSNDEVFAFKSTIKDTFEDEIADSIIRLFDLCGYLNIDIDTHIKLKLDYNKTRENKHGKNY